MAQQIRHELCSVLRFWGDEMVKDSRGIEYDPFLPSVMSADHCAVFQVVTDEIDPDTGLRVVDMSESVRLATEYDSQHPV